MTTKTTKLAAAKTAATATDITIEANASKTVGIFTDEATGIPAHEGVVVYRTTPGLPGFEFLLNGNCKSRVIAGPCVLSAVRRVTTVNIGVFEEA